jgi:MFS family permease
MPRASSSARWVALREILAVGHLRRMYAVVGLSAATDVGFFLAVSVVAYGDGGPGAVGLVGAARVLPGALCLGFVAVVADRVSRPLLVAAANVALVGICLLMAALVAAGGSLVLLVLLQVAASVATALVHPSLHGLLPRLVPLPSQLIQAGAVWSLLSGIGAVLGPGTGGWLLGRGGPDLLFLALAVVHALTAVVAGSIRTTYQPAREPSRPARRAAWWWSPLRGIGLFAAPGARTMLALSLVQRALGGFVGAVLVLYAFEVFGADGQARSGTLLAAVGVGGLVGSTITLGVVGRHTRWWFAAGLLVSALPLVALGATTEVGPAMLALGVCGVGAAWTLIYGSSLVTRLLPDHVAGRGWGALLGLGAGATALGALAAPLLARLLGLSEAMLGTGVLVAVAVLAAVPGLHALAGRTVPQADVVALLSGVGVLSRLPGICIERLAVAGGRWAVEPGEVVVHQGQPGQEFFVVVDGELVVSVEGREVRRLRSGDAFGEVALLRPVPRTATVEAASRSVLLTLDRDAFVTTVTGHRPTDAWAESVVADVLAEDARRG